MATQFVRSRRNARRTDGIQADQGTMLFALHRPASWASAVIRRQRAAHRLESLTMQGLIGVTRIYWKHAAILLATGFLFQLAALHSGAQDKPKRPRITGIDHVRLYVTDIDKSN